MKRRPELRGEARRGLSPPARLARIGQPACGWLPGPASVPSPTLAHPLPTSPPHTPHVAHLPAATASDVYSLLPPEAKGGDGEFWGVQWSAELGKYLAPFVMQASGAAGGLGCGCVRKGQADPGRVGEQVLGVPAEGCPGSGVAAPRKVPPPPSTHTPTASPWRSRATTAWCTAPTTSCTTLKTLGTSATRWAGWGGTCACTHQLSGGCLSLAAVRVLRASGAPPPPCRSLLRPPAGLRPGLCSWARLPSSRLCPRRGCTRC